MSGLVRAQPTLQISAQRITAIVVLCFLAQNCAVGLTFGSFGTLLTGMEKQLHVSRASASLGVSVLSLAMGGLAPLAGPLLKRVAIRTVMIASAVAMAAAYAGLALTSSYGVTLVLFAVAGAGMVMLGVIGPLVVVTSLPSARGSRLLALVNMPILLLLTPFAVAEALPTVGRSGVLLIIAGFFLFLVPVIALSLTPPIFRFTRRALQANATADTDRYGSPGDLDHISAARTRRLALLLQSLGAGMFAGGGVAYMVHIVPFGLSRGLPLAQSSLLISLYCATGIGGTLVAGHLLDRVGPFIMLAAASLLQALLWIGISHSEGVMLYGAAAAMGFFMTPIMTLNGAAVATIYEPSEIGAAMGLSYLLQLPFQFGFPPAVALAFEISKSYAGAFAALSVSMLLPVGMFLGAQALARRISIGGTKASMR